VDEGGIPLWKWLKILAGLIVLTFICGCLSALQNVFLRACRGIGNCLHSMSDTLGEYTIIGQQQEEDADEIELGDIDEDLHEHRAYFDELDNRAQNNQPNAVATEQSHPYPAGWSNSVMNPLHQPSDEDRGWSAADARQYHSAVPVTTLYVKSPSFPNMLRLKQETISSTPIASGRSLPDIVKCTTLYNAKGEIADSLDENVFEEPVNVYTKVFF
jgi:hypothetical protein